MNLSEYLLDYLKNLGIKHAFLVTGGAVAFIVDKFDENKNLKHICTTHEQGAAIAAEAYARVSNNLGVAMATSGPGATNLLTGIACAYFDSIPVIYITGQVNMRESSPKGGPRQIGFQETDIVSIAKPITKFAIRVENPEDIRFYLDKAVYEAKSGRPGPVLLDLPMNLQNIEIEPDKLRAFTPEQKQISIDEQINKTLDLIKEAKRPIIILGAGVKRGLAKEKTRKFVEKLGIPVVVSWGGIDILPHDHPLFVEAFGVAANRVGNFAVQNSDLVISLGSRLDTRQTGGKPETFARAAKKVVLDVDNVELHKGRGLKIDVAIPCDIDNFLDNIDNKIDSIEKPDISAWKEKIKQWKEKYPICKPEYYEQKDKVNPYVFMNELSKQAKEGDIITTDTGATLAWTMQGFKVKDGQRLFSAVGHSPMGYSLPASMGACFAADKKPVICITGDGGLKMNINELETIVRHKLPIKIFVMNNHGYDMIKQFQDTWLNSQHKASSVEGGLGNSDLVQVANAFGLHAIRINNHEELNKIREALDHDGPVFCSVELKPGEKNIPKVEFGKPIEDTAPLLTREEFKENMIIDPID